MSKQLQPFKQSFSEIQYANIELRPRGILIHYTNKLERFAWGIPYCKLHIYKAAFFSIHADGHFIQFKKDKHYKTNQAFINKMIDSEINTLQLGYYD